MDRVGITIGGIIVYDYIKIIDNYPKVGQLANILSMGYSVGGAVPNTLIDLARMDNTIFLQAIGMIGNDEAGKYVLEILKKNNINTEMVYIQNNAATSFTDDVVIESTGERTFFHYRGANTLLDISHFDFAKIHSKILHIGYPLLLDRLDSEDIQYGTKLARLFSIAQKQNIETSIDLVSENSDRFSKIVPPALKYTDYCTINEIEASLTTNIPLRNITGKLIINDMKKVCFKLKEMGVRRWVIVHCPEGAFALDEDDNYYIQPSFDLPKDYIKGTVGAGDAFCAGILYSVYQGWNMSTALKVGTASATACLSKSGTTDGISNIKNMTKLFDYFPPRKLGE